MIGRTLVFTLLILMFSVLCFTRAEGQSHDKSSKPPLSGKISDAQGNTLEVTPVLLNINGPGGKLSINIKADGQWKIVLSDKWIKCDTTKGKFSSTVLIKVEENFDMKARIGKLSVMSGDLPPVIVEIVQKGQHGE